MPRTPRTKRYDVPKAWAVASGSESPRPGSGDVIFVSPQPQISPRSRPPRSRSRSMQASPSKTRCNTPALSARGSQKRQASPEGGNRSKRQRQTSPILVDLTTVETDPEDTAQSTTNRPPLPFRSQDLERFISKPGQLNDEIINTFFEFFVALEENLMTASSGIWVIKRPGQNKLPCTPPSIFILPVNVDNKHWVCLVIDVKGRAVELYDSLAGQDHRHWDDTCLGLGRRFISEWLPEPFNDWDKGGWQTKGPTHNPQQPNLDDCGLYCLASALYRALGQDIPPSLDNRFLRFFFHSLAVNINYATVTSSSTPLHNDENQPAISDSDILPLRYLHALPPDCVPKYMDKVPGLPLGNLNEPVAALSAATLPAFTASETLLFNHLAQARAVVNSYVDAEITALNRQKMAADPFALLAAALCAAGQNAVQRMAELESAEVALENIRHASTHLVIINKATSWKWHTNTYHMSVDKRRELCVWCCWEVL